MAKYIDMAKLLVEIKFAKSISEAVRLIKQGAVRIYPPQKDVEVKKDVHGK